MKAVLLYSHPNPQSFNAAILDAVKDELGRKGAEIKVKDLYAMNWNPVLSAGDFQQMAAEGQSPDVAAEQADIKWTDLVVIISPIWWYSVTAMMKGYVDRVFSQGFAYEYRQDGVHGLMGGKKVLIITTSGADQGAAKASGMDQALQTSLVDGFCGFAAAKRLNCYAVPTVSDAERKQMLEQVRQFVRDN
jgi:NAD(P)H dehydrogenase (quinone)